MLMYLKEVINLNQNNFIDLCKTHQVKKLYAFGSSITSDFDESKSDIDLLIEIDQNDPLLKGEKLMSIWDKFESFFNKKVDLLTNSSIKNPVFKNIIDKNKALIYDGEEEKIFI